MMLQLFLHMPYLRSSNSDYLVNDHAPTSMSLASTAASFNCSKITKLSFSAKHELKSFGTAANLTLCRLVQCPFSNAQWSTKTSTPHLGFEINRPWLELESISLGNVGATLDFHSQQILTSANSASHASRLSSPWLMLLERYSSAIFASKPGKSANYLSRCLPRDLSAEDLTNTQRMHWYNTAPQIMRWDPSDSRCFSTLYKMTGQYTHDNSANYALTFSGTASSTLIRLYVDW